MSDLEIEIKVKVERVEDLLSFLNSQAKHIGSQHQVDQYFVPAHRDFLLERPTREWLRLRESDGKYSINYKNWHFDTDGKTNECNEHETRIEDIDACRKVFNALNMRLITEVDKERNIWNFEDYEISIDRVKNLGDFVEIEYKCLNSNSNSKEITEKMVEFLKDKNCGNISRNYQGYPFLLLFPDEAKFEDQ